ncbi:MAG: N-formylglutamate amidohydrolase [Acetobacteraceae bacterium]
MTLTPLLMDDAPAPFILHPATYDVPFILVCDHAGKRIPERLGDLGVPEADRTRHIAWDIGIAGVARRLCMRLWAQPS